MREFITNSCTSILTCGEIILYILRVAFFSAPILAIKNIILPRYMIIGSVFLILWIISYIISKKYTEQGFVRRGWMFGIRGFWITTFIFFRTGFPIPARERSECCFSDYPPYSALIPTIANIIIWQGIGYTIAYFFKRIYKKKEKPQEPVIARNEAIQSGVRKQNMDSKNYGLPRSVALHSQGPTLTILSLITIWLILFGFSVLALLFD